MRPRCRRRRGALCVPYLAPPCGPCGKLEYIPAVSPPGNPTHEHLRRDRSYGASPPHWPARDIVRFGGDRRGFRLLLADGPISLMCTLGIYRFSLASDIRRCPRCNTEPAGERFEYAGTAREPLLDRAERAALRPSAQVE